jgi:hypothetical protein
VPGGPSIALPICTMGDMSVAADVPVTVAPRPPADRFMRRLLRVDGAAPATAGEARKAFQTSVLVAAVRCLLTYIVLPFVLPVIGLAAGVTPIVGAIIGAIAVVCIISSMRRFWRADHRARWGYTLFGGMIAVFLVGFVIRDIVVAF